MFGYIAINKAEMKFKDYDVYQAYYCGLCRRLKECYGKRGQLTLSYDISHCPAHRALRTKDYNR